MKLIKDNLIIRNAIDADAEQLCKWWNDGKIMAHAGYPNGLGITPDEIRKSLATDDDKVHRRHIIEFRGRPIGEMNYRNKGSKTAEIGIKICDFTEQGKGLGTTLLTVFIDALFTYYRYEKIILDTNIKNKRAQHVYEKKLRFKSLGVRKESFIDYELVKDNWLERAGKSLNYIHLRLETPADYRAVEEMTREAFWRFWGTSDQKITDVHLLVHKLRSAESFVPELNFVAEIDSKIVGHIIYSKSKVVDDEGKEHETLTFGPLTALPEFQGMGIGKALMFHSFDEARRLGFRAVIIFGHPDYYPRVGFRRAAEFGITTSEGKTFDPFMALPLYEKALDGIKGKYYIDPVYDSLTQEEALEFDKSFPPKEAFKPTPIEALLNRLEPSARAEIEKLDKKTIDYFHTMSERNIRALPGISDFDIAIIRLVMREYGYIWGES